MKKTKRVKTRKVNKERKTFLYRLTLVRKGKRDNVPVMGGTHYYPTQLLLVIEAEDAEHAVQALNTKIESSFVRMDGKLPTVYYTSDYYGERPQPFNHKEGFFYLSLKELEEGDKNHHPDLAEKIRLKITAPPRIA